MYCIHTNHFKGQGWAKDQNADTNEVLKQIKAKLQFSIEDICVENARPYSSTKLKHRLLKAGVLKNECAVCGLTSWLGSPITLHLDHINGSHSDNRIENLRIVCPNCHQQTKTWGRSPIGRRQQI